MDRINHHHLFYFWAVGHEGNLTTVARRLHVSQSAVSAQIRQLEGDLGTELFSREGRRLVLTEAGRIALGYADEIFALSTELLSTMRQGALREQRLRVGTVATLSRNFQESFLKPLLDQPDVRLRLISGSLEELLGSLANHSLDLVLSNRRPPVVSGQAWRCRRVARQPVSLIGHPRRREFRFPDHLRDVPLIAPGPNSDVRSEFDALCERLGVTLRIQAEVDDMATMRLLARDTEAVALLPSIVVRDELLDGTLHEYCVVPGLFETFYSISVERQYQNPLLQALVVRDEDEMLAMNAEDVV